MYQDLREFIAQVDELGALRRIAGADPRFEVGGITEVAAGLPDCPALLFDRLKGCAPGFRIFTNATTTPQRAALALGIDPKLRPLDALKDWMKKRQNLKPLPPKSTKAAPFLENSMRGSDVDLGKLPAPYWHRKDGGAFIGSGSHRHHARSRRAAGSTPRSTACRFKAGRKSPSNLTIRAGTARLSQGNIGTKANPVRSRLSMARTRRCSSPASNICRRASPNTTLPAQSRARRLKCSPAR